MFSIYCYFVNTFSLFLLILIAVAAYFGPELMAMLAPGIVDDPATFEKGVRMTRITLQDFIHQNQFGYLSIHFSTAGLRVSFIPGST